MGLTIGDDYNDDEVFVDHMHRFCVSLLEKYFTAVSQEVFGMDYSENIEHLVWRALQGAADEREYLMIDERDTVLLKAISKKLGGWLLAKPATRSGVKRSYRFESSPSWKRNYTAWEKSPQGSL